MRNPTHNRESRGTGRPSRLHVGFVVAALALVGCHTEHEIDVKPTHHTVKIEPIYMTVDINLRVQQELDQFYSDVVGGPEEQPGQGGEL